MNFDDFLPVFISESQDNLTIYEDSLVEMSNGNHDAELVNTMFRAIHSIKGGAGMFDAARLVDIAHLTETTLDMLRSDELSVSDELIDTFFLSKDIIEAYVHGLQEGEIKEDARESELREQLNQYCHEDDTKQTETDKQPTNSETSNRLVLSADADAFQMGFKFHPLIMDIEEQYQVKSKQIVYSGPELSKLNPEECHLKVVVTTEPSITEDYVEELLSFSACAVGKLEPIETEDNSIPETQTVQTAQQNTSSQGLKEDKEGAEKLSEKTDTNNKPAVKQTQQKVTAKRSIGQLIKVDSLKLDSLVDEVGELLMLKAQLNIILEESGDQAVKNLLSSIDKNLDNLRDTSLSLRLVPLDQTLNRFHRVVREAAKAIDKKIELEVIGGATELDRVTVEKIVDPLVHIVRNSCDHGIESPADRLAADKSETGNVTIKAQYKGSGVSISIIDDGKGLPKDIILNKAIERGVVKSTDVLTDQEIFKLIFHAGLSTAEKVTDLSGRGVGMDVVRRNIQELGGVINIDSEWGYGTTIEILLPLTTAILDGFAVTSGDATFIIQMDAIRECIRRDEYQRRQVKNENCLELRGEYLPIIDVAHELGINSTAKTHEGVIVGTQNGDVVLALDALIGELQTVVKPLDALLKYTDQFSGIVRLASGEIGFVIDINNMTAKAMAKKRMQHIEEESEVKESRIDD